MLMYQPIPENEPCIDLLLMQIYIHYGSIQPGIKLVLVKQNRHTLAEIILLPDRFGSLAWAKTVIDRIADSNDLVELDAGGIVKEYGAVHSGLILEAYKSRTFAVYGKAAQ